MRPWILYLIAGLITYGSFYPFNFSMSAARGTVWEALLRDSSLWSSRMDMFDNVLLFAPFGFAGILVIASNKGLATRITQTVLWGFALALAVQVGQVYLPSRTPALSDVFWNIVGIGVGIIGGLNVRLSSQRLHSSAMLPLGIIALWLAAELLPFVPSLDVQSIRSNLKGLLVPAVAYDQIIFHAAGLLLAGQALSAVMGKARASRWLLLLAGVVAAGKVMIVTLTLTVSVVAGLVLGCVAWWLMRSTRDSQRTTVVLIALFVAYASGALMPFEVRDTSETMNLIPFAALLRGSMLNNVQSLVANLSLFAGMLWLMHAMGGRLVACSVGLAALALLFETAQIYLVGRTADITEPLLTLLLGQFMYAALQADSSARAALSKNQVPPRSNTAAQPVASSRAAQSQAHPATPFNGLAWSATLTAVCLIMALIMHQVLRLPRIPYNLRELFLGDGAYPFLVIFMFALLWIGAGAHLAAYYITRSKRPWLTLPLFAFGAGVVSLLLLFASVTQESVADIAGANNLHWFVINKDIWGTWARELFTLLPPIVVACFERPVRYASLYGPLVTFLILMLIVARQTDRNEPSLRGGVALLISTALWLWLCKGIAFDWSSTDNLNELIARDGPAGWGGGGYLYALVALLCANAVLLSRMRLTIAWVALAASLTVVAVPIGWWLLNNGLEPFIQKYSLVFSGVQFLLGPDRKDVLPDEILFLRWTAVQLSGVMVMAAGARIVQPLLDKPSSAARGKAINQRPQHQK